MALVELVDPVEPAATADKAAYQRAKSGAAETQYDMLRRLELPWAAHRALKEQCDALGIEFMSTPFDTESATFLVREVGVKRLKSPSGEITRSGLPREAASSRLLANQPTCPSWLQ